MTPLPVIFGEEAARALRKIGYELDHQTGSHMILRQASPPCRRLTVPKHRTLSKGTLRAIIRNAGLSVDEFTDLLR